MTSLIKSTLKLPFRMMKLVLLAAAGQPIRRSPISLPVKPMNFCTRVLLLAGRHRRPATDEGRLPSMLVPEHQYCLRCNDMKALRH